MLVLVVLVNVLGGRADGDRPASVAGTSAAPREDLPVLPVEVPEVTPEAEEHCPGLMGDLPFELAGDVSRRVESDTLNAYAWGDPATVLVCGVDRPEGFTVGAGLIQINGVQWFVDTSDPGVDRPVFVEVQVPADSDSAGVTALTVPIAEHLAQQDPDPAG